jgi:hypothetical protein
MRNQQWRLNLNPAMEKIIFVIMMKLILGEETRVSTTVRWGIDLKALKSGVGGFIKLTHRILIKLLSHLLFYNSNNTVSYIWTKYIFYNLMITVRSAVECLW